MSAETVDRPEGHALSKPSHKGAIFSVIVYSVLIVAIFVSAVVVNLVMEEGADFWFLTLFGAVIISVIISAAAIPSIREISQH